VKLILEIKSGIGKNMSLLSGFCNFVFCSEHMRKKRKNKEVNKFVRICDNCEDRYLYSKYMKLEVKN